MEGNNHPIGTLFHHAQPRVRSTYVSRYQPLSRTFFGAVCYLRHTTPSISR
jgi:hypothetical protein